MKILNWWMKYLGDRGLKAFLARAVLGAARNLNNHAGMRVIARHMLPRSVQAGIQQQITRVITVQVEAPAPIRVEARTVGTLTLSPRMLTTRRFRVLYITVDVKFASHLLRVTNYQEYLRLGGIESDYIEAGDVANHMLEIPRYDVVVVFRVILNNAIRRVYEICRQAGVPVIYDIDDYIFESTIMTLGNVDGLRFLSETDLNRYLSDIPKYREAIVAADWCTLSTEYLAERVREMGKNAFVLLNGINRAAQRRCADAISAPSLTEDWVTLGYFSGTKTHQKDFAVIVEPLVQIMTEYQNVRLFIAGYMDLAEFPALTPFQNRIDRRAHMPWEHLHGEIAKVDVNLAPLEIDNPFCQAKSELKYIDAGFVKVPTVATATMPFQQAIRNGENGFVAGDPEDWVRALQYLVQHTQNRIEMGEKAYQHVTQTYSPDALAVTSRAVFTDVINTQRKRLGVPDTSLALSIVLPSRSIQEIEMLSEHLERVFTLARHLVSRGHEVRIYEQCNSESVPRQFWNNNQNKLLKFGGDIGEMVCCDAMIATDWTSAHWVKKLECLCRRGFYFVQSDEATLYPIGDQTVNAKAALALGLYLIHLSWRNSALQVESLLLEGLYE